MTDTTDPVRAQLHMELEARARKFALEHIEPHLPHGVEFVLIYADPETNDDETDPETNDVAYVSNMHRAKAIVTLRAFAEKGEVPLVERMSGFVRAAAAAVGWPLEHFDPQLFLDHLAEMRRATVDPPPGITTEDMERWVITAARVIDNLPPALTHPEMVGIAAVITDLAKAVHALAPIAKRMTTVAALAADIHPAELERLRELHVAADKAPWGTGDPDSPGVVWSDADAGREIARGLTPPNAAFVAAARAIVPRLGVTIDAIQNALPPPRTP